MQNRPDFSNGKAIVGIYEVRRVKHIPLGKRVLPSPLYLWITFVDGDNSQGNDTKECSEQLHLNFLSFTKAIAHNEQARNAANDALSIFSERLRRR
jgi:hypothetical protein